MNAAIDDELRNFGMPESAEFVQTNSVKKDSHGAVNKDYRTTLGYKELRSYYDTELQRYGWRFVNEKVVLWDNTDQGGHQAFYCKGKYKVVLEYAGRLERNFGWTYSIAVSWGMNDRDSQCS